VKKKRKGDVPEEDRRKMDDGFEIYTKVGCASYDEMCMCTGTGTKRRKGLLYFFYFSISLVNNGV